MKNPRDAFDAAWSLFQEVREKQGELAALAAALHHFSAGRDGHATRRPHSLVIQTVCEHYEVSLHDLLWPRRFAQVVLARRVAVYLMQLSHYSEGEIAEALNISRSAVCQAGAAVRASEELQDDAGVVARLIEQKLGDPGMESETFPKLRAVG